MIDELNLQFLKNHGSFMIQNSTGIKTMDDRSYVIMNEKGGKKKRLPSMKNGLASGIFNPY